MKQSAWIAIGLLAATAAWIASGYIVPSGEKPERQTAQAQPTLVEVQQSQSRPIGRYVFGQGFAHPFRTLDVTGEVSGTIRQIEVERGDRIEDGAVVAHIALDERAQSLQSAQARLETLEAELDNTRQLEDQGVATQSQVRELEAQVEEARAALAQVEATIEDTTVTSAIPGVMSAVHVNEGQTVAAGAPLATVIDNSPLRVELQVAQTDVGRIEPGTVALVNFATGHSAKGRLCYVAPIADEATQTFLVEVRVPNEDRAIPSGISAELRVDAGEIEAHFASSAILSLNEQGELGIKAVGEDKQVDFYPAQIVRSSPEGVWLSGLPDELDIIAVGQGFVRPGEPVRVAEASPAGETATPPTEAAPGAPAGAVNLPTASVQAQGLQEADDLAEPPPADEICALRGADAAGTSTAGAATTAPDMQTAAGAAAPTGSSRRPSSPSAGTSPAGAAPTDAAPAAPQPAAPQPTAPAPTAPATAQPPPAATPAAPQGGGEAVPQVEPFQPVQPAQPGGSQAPSESGGAP